MNTPIKKSIITIAGRPGSGKSTASKAVAAELGHEHFSSGDLFRAIGKERGADVYQTNVIAKNDKSIDKLVDQRLRDIGRNQDFVVIDSRLAWHWMPQSFKIFLDLDLEAAAKRILANIDEERLSNEHIPDDAKKYAERLQHRLNEESERYKSLYNVNPYDTENYDLVINTESASIDEVREQIIAEFRAWRA